MDAEAHRGLLTAVPPDTPPAPGAAPGPGTHPVGRSARGGVLVVPRSVDPARPAPLLVFFHGAGGDRSQGLAILGEEAEALGALLLVPESLEGGSWDFIVGEYGTDVAALDAALNEVFRTFAIDPGRRVLSGFSDGASYALSLGLGNGELFTHVMAFSPGFAAPVEIRGKPRFFISHSPEDRVLPISRTSRALVPKLRNAGYAVEYLEFEGGHLVPQPVVDAGLRWVEQEQVQP